MVMFIQSSRKSSSDANRCRRKSPGWSIGSIDTFSIVTQILLCLFCVGSLSNHWRLAEAFCPSPSSLHKHSHSYSYSHFYSEARPWASQLAAEGPTGTEREKQQQAPETKSQSWSFSVDDADTDTTYHYTLRDCQYRELSNVATLVVASFYDPKTVSNMMARKLTELAEMNRLQQNFPYPESRSVHRMLVIVAQAVSGSSSNSESSEEPTVVGFCDVDARPCATQIQLPRPYLSDLAVDPNHRRRGLAKVLVEVAEDFVRTLDNSSSNNNNKSNSELWIRVASDNAAALGLYRDKLGYSLEEWDTGEKPKSSNQPEVWTLRKDLGASE